jgi:hypothetical protein
MQDEKIKYCKKCKQLKPFSLWLKSGSTTDGFGQHCLSCEKARRDERMSDPNRRERLLAGMKYSTLRKRYGLSKDEYEALLLANPVCSICGSVFSVGLVPMIDHCHKSGTIRGVLCSSCNSLLGFSRDDLSVLHKALSYLLDFGARDGI